MDPLTALAAIKTGVAAGMQMHNLSKEIAGFFDATDGAKRLTPRKRMVCLHPRTKRLWQHGHKHRMQRPLKLNCVFYCQQQRLLRLSGSAEDTP